MSLPIDAVLPELLATLAAHPACVLSAAPGAGKTTRVPLALLEADLIEGKIIMLEPRRLAAIRAAQYMAAALGEKPGQTIGYRVRGETKSSANTRIEVVTEGILTRMLQDDPELAGIGLIIFDEFHERSIHADLGLALAWDCQQIYNSALKLLVMSATLDTEAVGRLLDGAPVVASEGHSFPVGITYVGKPANQYELPKAVAQTCELALKQQAGDILVFLPGIGEIRRTEAELQARLPAGVELHKLYGEASLSEQQAALAPTASARKIILATSIAETSLTIDGVTTVIDAGLVRSVRFDPNRGMQGLVTLTVSQATATQRAGRAGRQQPGHCYRLWRESDALPAFPEPEISQSDLMPLALEVARWGNAIAEMKFLTQPPAAHYRQARDLLGHFAALDEHGNLSEHGRALAALPVHPRLGQMLIKAQQAGLGATACYLAAALEERDLLKGERQVDLELRLQALGGSSGAANRARQQAKRLLQLLGASGDWQSSAIGAVLALAFPDRIGKSRAEHSGRYALASGIGAKLPAGDPLAREDLLACADIDGEGADTTIRQAAALDITLAKQLLPALFSEQQTVQVEPNSRKLQARCEQRLGLLVLSSQTLPLQAGDLSGYWLDFLQALPLTQWPISEQAQLWLNRARWLAAQNLPATQDWPALDDQTLQTASHHWLAAFIGRAQDWQQLAAIDWLSALAQHLPYGATQLVEQLAPAQLPAATGNMVTLDYRAEQPVMAVRLQEMFGVAQTPTVLNGAQPVLVHLLSPARRPLAVTQDLASFWQNAYIEVRKDMRGQYPKHYWPEDPLAAEATARSKAADDRARKRSQ